MQNHLIWYRDEKRRIILFDMKMKREEEKKIYSIKKSSENLKLNFKIANLLLLFLLLKHLAIWPMYWNSIIHNAILIKYQQLTIGSLESYMWQPNWHIYHAWWTPLENDVVVI